MKTHPIITHPALRHRMAVALNQLRQEKISWELAYERRCRYRMARLCCERMAALEQALDDAQEARIFGTIPS